MELHFLEELVNSPLFGILISLIAFQIGDLLYKKTQLSVLSPLPVAIILVILFLFYFRIDFETYNLGGEYIPSSWGLQLLFLPYLFTGK